MLTAASCQCGILRGHTQSSLGKRGMKIWSTPHSDMGVTGTITVNLAVVKLGYMLEHPSILRYSLYGHTFLIGCDHGQ